MQAAQSGASLASITMSEAGPGPAVVNGGAPAPASPSKLTNELARRLQLAEQQVRGGAVGLVVRSRAPAPLWVGGCGPASPCPCLVAAAQP